MGFVRKIWKNRISEYPTRRTLTKEDGSTELVTVSRSEGTVSQEGDAFSEENMNGLELRILNAIGEGEIPKELGTDIISAIIALNSNLYGTPSILDTNLIGGAISFCNRAGICFVRITISVLSNITTDTIIATGFPIPAIEPRLIVASNGNVGNGQFYVDGSGNLVVSNAILSGVYFFTFSYPIM